MGTLGESGRGVQGGGAPSALATAMPELRPSSWKPQPAWERASARAPGTLSSALEGRRQGGERAVLGVSQHTRG